jgi:hypothetical protein
MAPVSGGGQRGVMRCFLVEIPLPQPDPAELERARRTLWSARSRLNRSGNPASARVASVDSDNGRMVALIEAPTLAVVRQIVALALLPAPRIREVTSRLAVRARFGAGGRCPCADLGSGADSELVENVVDVGLDGALGDE